MESKFRLLVPLAYMAGIFALSSIPDTGQIDSPIDQVFQWVSPQMQNLLHIPLFGGLAGSWFWALTSITTQFRSRISTGMALTLLYSVADEVHQLSVPGRFGSYTDILLNVIGAFLALILLVIWSKRSNCERLQ